MKIEITAQAKEAYSVPEVKYCFYKYIVAIDHHKDMIYLIENLMEGETKEIGQIESLLRNLTFSPTQFDTVGEEVSNITNEQYKHMVSKGKEQPVCTEMTEACWQQNRRGHPIVTAK